MFTVRCANTKSAGRGLTLAGAGLFLMLGGVTGCTHGSDDTGGGSSAGSMSGATGPQGTQAMANHQGPPPGGGPYVAPPAPNANTNGTGAGANGGANAAPASNSGG